MDHGDMAAAAHGRPGGSGTDAAEPRDPGGRNAAGTAALGAALLLVAAAFDAEPLLVPGAAFLLLALGAVGWVALGARRITVRRTVSARRVQEEDPVTVEVVVDGGALALPSGALLDPLLGRPAPLAAGRPLTRVRIEARFGRRGPRVLEPPRVVVRDPLGLASRSVRGGDPSELLVLPRVEPVRAPDGAGEGAGPVTGRGRPVVAAEVELDGLRELREGSSASRVYWPSLAKGGALLERRLRADGDARPLLVLDPRAADAEEDLDAAVRATASLAVHLARRGGVALLLPGDRRPTALEASLHGWGAVHVRLALLDDRGTPSLAGMASRRGPVVYVAARAGSRPPRALAHAPAGNRVLVLPGPPQRGRRALFSTGGCTGYDLTPQHRGSGRRSGRRAFTAASAVPLAPGGPTEPTS